MNVKRTMGVVTPTHSVLIWMVDEGVSVISGLQVMASSAQTLMNAQTKGSAIGMLPASITLALMGAHVILAIKEMETTCAWT